MLVNKKQKNFLQPAVSLLLALLGYSFFSCFWAAPVSAGEVIFPSSSKVLIQTNGPYSEFDDGDWWTHKDYGNGPHIFLLQVPSSTDPNFIVEVMLFDPESYNADPASPTDNDERKLGPWENTTFTLFSPSHAQIHSFTYAGGDITTNQQWVDFCNFRVGDWGTGMYQLEVRVAGDDENGYKIGIKNGDTDHDATNGNEISLWAKHTAFQMIGSGHLCHTFWFRVPPRMQILHLYNFDLDSEGASIHYISPSGQTINGTPSLEAMWNTNPPQSQFPTGDADQIVNPEAGWWQAYICVNHLTQYVDDGDQFIFLPDDLPFKDTPDDDKGKIGDLVWVDANMNGLQDEGEEGLSGVTVRLLDGTSNAILRTTTTNEYGIYLFDQVSPGLYRVEFVQPENFFYTAALVGSNSAIDSDAIPPEGRSNVISLGPEEINFDIDAGMISKNVSDLQIEKTIEGADHIRPGAEAVYVINVTNLGPDAATHVRISDNIPSGLTFVEAQPPQQSGPNPLHWYENSIAAGQTITYRVRVRAEQALGTLNNCAFVSSPHKDENLSNNISCATLYVEDGHSGSNITIGDHVWIDTNENGLQDSGEPNRAGVSVNLLDANSLTLIGQTTTDLLGHYSFSNVPPGRYLLEFVLPSGFHFTRKKQGGDDTIDSDADPITGRTDAFDVVVDHQYLNWDAGLIANKRSDLQVSKTIQGDRSYFYIDEEFEFILTVGNNGPDDARNVTIVDNLPDGLHFVSAVRAQDEGPNPLIWRENLIPVGGSVTYRVRMRATKTLGGMDNCVTAVSETEDPNMQNNIACVQVHILVPVELSSFTAAYQHDRIVLQWVTQSETENMGFHILRSESAEGMYLQITKEIIPGAGTSTSAHTYTYMDEKLPAGKTYYYKLADIDYKGRINLHGPVSAQAPSPEAYVLEQNYPNPFNPDTKINFVLKQAGEVQLKVFNVKGELVRTLMSQQLNAGSYMAIWDGKDENGKMMTSGLYIYSLRINNYEEKRTMMLLK